MKLRTRMTLAAAAAVFVSIVAMAVATYVVVRTELQRQVDDTLETQVERIRLAPTTGPNAPAGRFERYTTTFSDSYLQLIDSDGNQVVSLGSGDLPPTDGSAAVAAGTIDSAFEVMDIDGTEVRVLTRSSDQGLVRVGRSLKEMNTTLDRLTAALVAFGVAGIGLAALLGRASSAAAIAPVQRLCEQATEIDATKNLQARLTVAGQDEVAALAVAFNAILGDLETAQRLQRQLVADASHELRTPLTTLRTNIDVLGRDHSMSERERRHIVDDIQAQLEDLTHLVGDLIDLARDETTDAAPEAVQLDALAAEAVDRASRQRPALHITLHTLPTTVWADPTRLERALHNLLDNAAKWSAPGGTVEVTVEAGSVQVRDHGPGIDAADLPYVFDRFYRAPDARQLPGSGLGLAIVAQAAKSAGGSVTAANAPDGGALLHLKLPVFDPSS